jgi:hypothetical protein
MDEFFSSVNLGSRIRPFFWWDFRTLSSESIPILLSLWNWATIKTCSWNHKQQGKGIILHPSFNLGFGIRIKDNHLGSVTLITYSYVAIRSVVCHFLSLSFVSGLPTSVLPNKGLWIYSFLHLATKVKLELRYFQYFEKIARYHQIR